MYIKLYEEFESERLRRLKNWIKGGYKDEKTVRDEIDPYGEETWDEDVDPELKIEGTMTLEEIKERLIFNSSRFNEYKETFGDSYDNSGKNFKYWWNHYDDTLILIIVSYDNPYVIIHGKQYPSGSILLELKDAYHDMERINIMHFTSKQNVINFLNQCNIQTDDLKIKLKKWRG